MLWVSGEAILFACLFDLFDLQTIKYFNSLFSLTKMQGCICLSTRRLDKIFPSPLYVKASNGSLILFIKTKRMT